MYVVVTNFITFAKDVEFSSASVSQSVSQFVCLFIGGITQKLPNRFSQNSLEMWNMGQGRNDYILVAGSGSGFRNFYRYKVYKQHCTVSKITL